MAGEDPVDVESRFGQPCSDEPPTGPDSAQSSPTSSAIVTVVAGHGIEVHLDAVAGSDHHIASFGGHRGTFRELKNAGTPLSEVPAR